MGSTSGIYRTRPANGRQGESRYSEANSLVVTILRISDDGTSCCARQPSRGYLLYRMFGKFENQILQ
jgi:hypothetical protein